MVFGSEHLQCVKRQKKPTTNFEVCANVFTVRAHLSSSLVPPLSPIQLLAHDAPQAGAPHREFREEGEFTGEKEE